LGSIYAGFMVGVQPSGTVTFLFTDIEGSTHLWEEHPEDMGVGLERHDVILKDAMPPIATHRPLA
jgi:class 3 adenylate cyclase